MFKFASSQNTLWDLVRQFALDGPHLGLVQVGVHEDDPFVAVRFGCSRNEKFERDFAGGCPFDVPGFEKLLDRANGLGRKLLCMLDVVRPGIRFLFDGDCCNRPARCTTSLFDFSSSDKLT